jgi:ABC-type antimicrobial peptide transport system permease subunit
VIFCGFDSLEPMKIVGVVADVRQYGPAQSARPECDMPYLQHYYNGNTLSLLVRTSSDPSLLAEAVRRKARERSPEVSVKLTTMDALLAEHVATPRFRAILVGLFGGIGLCLAMAGVYGVMAYAVSQRSTEIGLRMALGASPRDVLWMVLRRGLRLATVGLALGVVVAFAVTRLLNSLLFEVKPSDGVTYLAVVALLGVMSTLAMYIPARRSAKIDPLVALRQV